MTEQEVLEKQEQNENSCFYLILIGTFLHAYGNGAFALARATGYHVLCRRRRKLGHVLTAGFPIGQLDRVQKSIEAAGGTVTALPDGKTWLFSGIDGTPDESLVVHPRSLIRREDDSEAPPDNAPAAAADERWLEKAVLGFELGTSTPIDAMVFLGTLQHRLRDGKK